MKRIHIYTIHTKKHIQKFCTDGTFWMLEHRYGMFMAWRSCVLSWIRFIITITKWNLMLQVLKYMSTPAEVHRGVEFYSECQYCNNKVRGASCLLCKRLVLQCSICNLSVRGKTLSSYLVTTQFRTGCLVRFLAFVSHSVIVHFIYLPARHSQCSVFFSTV